MILKMGIYCSMPRLCKKVAGGKDATLLKTMCEVFTR